jgi:hypothetical protein
MVHAAREEPCFYELAGGRMEYALIRWQSTALVLVVREELCFYELEWWEK